jgi:hypothetical protein
MSSFHVTDNFKPGTPIVAIGTEWFNKVGGFLNSLIGGLGVKIRKNNRPSASAPIIIEIDPDAVRKSLQIKETKFQEFETPSEENSTVSTGHAMNALLQTEWTRGSNKGFTCYLPFDSWGDGVSRSVAWRKCEFDRFGTIQRVHKQTLRTESVNIDQL